MIYEIINPSDAYTLEASDFQIACAAALVLGTGKYGLTSEDGKQEMPIFIFGGLEEWLLAEFKTDIKSLLSHHEEIATCLESVVIGGFQDRKTYFDGLALITDEANKQAWRDRWFDERRSSMNNIGARAENLAASTRKRINKALGVEEGKDNG